MCSALHPGEAKITGATTAFFTEARGDVSNLVSDVFSSIGNEAASQGWLEDAGDDLRASEAKFQKEVLKDDTLLGLYAYNDNVIRIYKDKAVYSWLEDENRSRDRDLSKAEFDDIKSYISFHHADEMPPFVQCGGDAYCDSTELLMLGRHGGRRVFMNGSPTPPFFVGLDKYFERLRKKEAKVTYALGKTVTGLEVLFANDAATIHTVWKKDADLRVAYSSVAAREKIDKEINRLRGYRPDDEDSDDDAPEATPGDYGRAAELETERKYEGYAWRSLTPTGGDGGVAEQPKEVGFLPIYDALPAKIGAEQWKARDGAVEYRYGGDGIYAVESSHTDKIVGGDFDRLVVVPKGKFFYASTTVDYSSKFSYRSASAHAFHSGINLCAGRLSAHARPRDTVPSERRGIWQRRCALHSTEP